MNPLRLPSIMTDLRSHAAVATETITVCTMLSTISKSRNFSRAHPSSRVNKQIFYEFSTDNKKSRTHFFLWNHIIMQQRCLKPQLRGSFSIKASECPHLHKNLVLLSGMKACLVRLTCFGLIPILMIRFNHLLSVTSCFRVWLYIFGDAIITATRKTFLRQSIH